MFALFKELLWVSMFALYYARHGPRVHVSGAQSTVSTSVLSEKDELGGSVNHETSARELPTSRLVVFHFHAGFVSSDIFASIHNNRAQSYQGINC